MKPNWCTPIHRTIEVAILSSQDDVLILGGEPLHEYPWFPLLEEDLIRTGKGADLSGHLFMHLSQVNRASFLILAKAFFKDLLAVMRDLCH